MARPRSNSSPPPEVPERRLVSLRKGAEYTSTEEDGRTLRRWAKLGLITLYSVGPKLTRVDLNEIDAMVQARKPANTGFSSAIAEGTRAATDA